MANIKEFFAKNKKPIYWTGGLIILAAGTIYGVRAYNKYRESKIQDETTPAPKTSMQIVKELLAKGLQPSGLPVMHKGPR